MIWQVSFAWVVEPIYTQTMWIVHTSKWVLPEINIARENRPSQKETKKMENVSWMSAGNWHHKHRKRKVFDLKRSTPPRGSPAKRSKNTWAGTKGFCSVNMHADCAGIRPWQQKGQKTQEGNARWRLVCQQRHKSKRNTQSPLWQPQGCAHNHSRDKEALDFIVGLPQCIPTRLQNCQSHTSWSLNIVQKTATYKHATRTCSQPLTWLWWLIPGPPLCIQLCIVNVLRAKYNITLIKPFEGRHRDVHTTFWHGVVLTSLRYGTADRVPRMLNENNHPL